MRQDFVTILEPFLLYQNPVRSNMVKENEDVKENQSCGTIWTISWSGSVYQAELVLGRSGFMWKSETFRPVGKPQGPEASAREGDFS